VCQCNGVTKGAIRQSWQDGARTVADIAATTHATTGCGTCRDTVCGCSTGWPPPTPNPRWRRLDTSDERSREESAAGVN